jgi:alanyl-tRNA synthetase
MGLERIAAILQNVDTNYEIDSFRSILDYTGKLANKAYDPKASDSFIYRVIADHARASAFLIADGVLPSNEGRGYVLRRIIRRAIRYGKNLGFEKPFLYQVCQFVVEQMSDAYPNLSAQKAFVARAVEAEEEQFFKTLERGLNLLDEEIDSLGAGKKLSGQMAFRLYDTFGFPLDLTTIICRERGIEVDEQGFIDAMQVQKQQSRKNWKGSGDDAVANIYHDVQKFLAGDSLSTSFDGYEQLSLSSNVLAMIKTNADESVMVETFSHLESETIELVFEKTCFYPEGGGQVGDKGTLSCKKTGFKAQVLDVIKPVPDLIVVKARPLSGSISVGDSCLQETDALHRAYSARNHTATHMLHWALRDTLGEHVKQAGSLVTSELLRFDFTHFQALTGDELQLVEDKVNQRIFAPSSVSANEMHKKQALASGAIAFFGEKYADKVRVVKVGDFSVELCGGTHVSSTSEINLFKIVSEASVASGVRRIVAYTSKAAFDYLATKARDAQSIQETLKAHSISDAQTRLEKLMQSEKELRKELDQIRSKSLMSDLNQMIASAKSVQGVRLLCYECPPDSKGVKTLRELADNIRQKAPDVLVVLGMKQPETEKVMLLVAKGSEVPGAVKAGDVVSKLAPKIEGRGGGKPDMAQAGGTKLDGLKDAFSSVEAVLSELLV